MRTLLLLVTPILVFAPTRALAAPEATITLTKTGTCPGQIDFFIANATPNGNVAIVHGTAGSTIKSGNPCNGMFIPVGNAQLGTVLQADAAGAAFFAILVLPSACGRNVSAIDVSSCTASAPIVI